MATCRNPSGILPYTPSDHPYFCDTEYRGVGVTARYRSWSEFREAYMPSGVYHDDRNYIARFDLAKRIDPVTERPIGGMEMRLFVVKQRMGQFLPVIIELITKSDMPEISAFLAQRWAYHRKLWPEFARQPGADGASL